MLYAMIPAHMYTNCRVGNVTGLISVHSAARADVHSVTISTCLAKLDVLHGSLWCCPFDAGGTVRWLYMAKRNRPAKYENAGQG